MKLLEFESKRVLAAAGFTVPKGMVVTCPEAVAAAVKETGTPVVLKVQIPSGGRMKAGGVLFAESLEEATDKTRALLGRTVLGHTVERVLVEQRLDVSQEFYLGVTYDTARKLPVIVASASGGIDVNELARREPGKVVREHVDVSVPFSEYRGREIGSALGLQGPTFTRFVGVVSKLYGLFMSYDATLAEVNPLVLTPESEFVAADAHVELDDDALYRHPELKARFGIEPRESSVRPPTPFELQAAQIDKRDYRGVAGRVVEFDGDLGLLIGGGGASLTAFDCILDYGGRPANYCEIGGNPSVGKISDLTRLILSRPGVSKLAVIMNIVNNTRVDLVARGVIKGVVESGKTPNETIVVFRIPGAWEEEGFKILRKYGVEYLDRTVSIDEAARRAVEKAG